MFLSIYLSLPSHEVALRASKFIPWDGCIVQAVHTRALLKINGSVRLAILHQESTKDSAWRLLGPPLRNTPRSSRRSY